MPKETPVYEGLKLSLKSRIDRGELQEGQQLPSEFDLVDQFGLSRHQVRQALRELELEGYLERAQGRGSFVAPRERRTQGIWSLTTKPVAICFPQYASLFARQIVEGFMQHMSNHGHQTVAYNMQFDDHSELDFLQSVRGSGVAGLVIWLSHSHERTQAAIAELHEAHFPIVLVDRYLPGIETDCVASDNEDIGYRLTQALLAQDHRRVAFVRTADQHFTSVEERQAGYRRAMREAGLSEIEQIVTYGYRDDECAAAVNEMMAQYRRPTAFCCINDLTAHQLYCNLARLGYTPGENVDIAAVDDDHVAEDAGILMVRVVQQAYAIGQRSAEFLRARMAEPDLPPQREFIKAGPVLPRQARHIGPETGDEKGGAAQRQSTKMDTPASAGTGT